MSRDEGDFLFLKHLCFSQSFSWNEESYGGQDRSAVHRTMRRMITMNRMANKMPIAHHCRRSVRLKSSDIRSCSNTDIYENPNIVNQHWTNHICIS